MGNALSWFVSFFYVAPEERLKNAELQLLQAFSNTSCQSQFIPISNRVEVRTLRFDIGFPRGSTPVVVLIHGFLSGLGVWSPCFDLLSQNCIIYAIDLPGFGRSTRIRFLGDMNDVEYQFVSYLEEWRDAVGLESFIIVGHGFGGYIGTLYAMKYPENVQHLVLVEPWGFTELPFGLAGKAVSCSTEYEHIAYKTRIPSWARVTNFIITIFSPFLLLRCLPTSFGTCICSSVFKSMSPILSSNKKFKVPMTNYIYHCNTMAAAGEYAYLKLSLLYFWANVPLIERLDLLDENVPISFIFGANSSVDHKTGFEVYHQRQQSVVEVYMVQKAGHSVFMDCPERFCDIVLHVVEGEQRRESSRNTLLSPALSEFGAEDLYWDSAWETINLSTANLSYMEDEEEAKNSMGGRRYEYAVHSGFDVLRRNAAAESDDEVYYPLD